MNILVTGASRGLGAALLVELARRGHAVVGVARGQDALDRVVGRVRSEGGIAYALVADLADKGAVYPLAGAAAALIGPIDVVVHGAATLGPVPLRLLGDTDCEDVERALVLNVLAPFRLTKALVGSMAVRGRGLVVHVTSDAGTQAYPTWGAYGVSKAALDHLGRQWQAELAGSGVRVLSFDPGEMDTQMHAEAVPDADRATLARPADVAEKLADRIVAAWEGA
jgi:NAD(P)-dependent dehydrogenase (short-subunit alcohol dehydrogenase family)